MDGVSTYSDNVRIECHEFSVGGTGYDEDYEREKAPGDAGWKEVL